MSYIEITEECGIINIDSPTHGHFDILIDLEDVEKCEGYTWSIQMSRCGKDKNYVQYYAKNTHNGLLHRYLTSATKELWVDHINGDTYDNRRYNLRVCRQEDNHKNRKEQDNNKSGHRGVIWYPYSNLNKWMAYICIDKKRTTLGYFDDFQEAVKTRKDAEIKYFGEYIRAEEFQ